MFIILPHVCFFIIGMTSREHKKQPFIETSTTKSYSSVVISSTRVGRITPALFTIMCTVPNVLTVNSTIFTTSSSQETSPLQLIAWPPDAVISSVTSLTLSTVTSFKTTLIPFCANVLEIRAPMPRPAPVIIATLPSTDSIFITKSCPSKRLFRQIQPDIYHLSAQKT